MTKAVDNSSMALSPALEELVFGSSCPPQEKKDDTNNKPNIPKRNKQENGRDHSQRPAKVPGLEGIEENTGSSNGSSSKESEMMMALPPALDALVFGPSPTNEGDKTTKENLQQCHSQQESAVITPRSRMCSGDTDRPGAFSIIAGGSPRQDSRGGSSSNSKHNMKLSPTSCSSETNNVNDNSSGGNGQNNIADATTAPPNLRRNPVGLNGDRANTPGAFPIAGPGLSTTSSDSVATTASTAGLDEPERDGGPSDRDTRRTEEIDDEELAVANPIDHSDRLSGLPLAQQMNFANSNSLSSEASPHGKKKVVPLALSLMAVLVVFSVVILLIVILTPHRSGPTSEAAEAASPTSPHPPATLPTFKDYVMTQLPVGVTSLLSNESILALENPESVPARAIQWLLADPNVGVYPEWRLVQRLALSCLYYSTGGEGWYNTTNWLSYEVSECHWASRHFSTWREEEYRFKPLFLADVCEDEETGVLNHLWLYDNLLKGTLPEEFFLLSSLKTFSLFSNPDLKGTIPTAIGKLTNIWGFCLTDTGVHGTLPSEIGLLRDVTAMSIAASKISGVIPSELGELTDVDILYMDESELTGTIPTDLGRLVNLKNLTLQRTHLFGPLPSQLGKLSSLVELEVQETGLSGTFPKELAALHNLTDLNIKDTGITGKLPTPLCSMDPQWLAFTCASDGGLLCGCNCTCDE